MENAVKTRKKSFITPKKITLAAIFMALNVIMSSFGIPVPGGSFYLCDAVICTAAILLDPVTAFAVGGIGSLIGDFFFYQSAMAVSLVVHGLQAAVISLVVNGTDEIRGLPVKPRRFGKAVIGVALGTLIMTVGYTIGAAVVYSTPEYAVINIPYELLQSGIGSAASLLICYRFGLIKVYDRFFGKPVAAN